MDFDQQLKQLKDANAKLLEKLKNNQAQFNAQRSGHTIGVATNRELTTTRSETFVSERSNKSTVSSAASYEKVPKAEATAKAHSNTPDEVIVTQAGNTEAARRQLANLNLSGGDDKYAYKDGLDSSLNNEYSRAAKSTVDSVFNPNDSKLPAEKGQETIRVRTPVRFSTKEDARGHRERSLNLTSTPTKSLQTDGQETPKSILKHRKIIEDNVHVKSQFDDSPLKQRSKSNSSGLNFSYSNVDDLELETLLPSYAKPRAVKSNNTAQSSKHSDTTKKSPTYQRATNGSYLEDMPHHTSDSASVEMPQENQSGIQSKLLHDVGNDRHNANIVRELSNRPKSFVFERENIDDNTREDNRLRYASQNGVVNANNSNGHVSIARPKSLASDSGRQDVTTGSSVSQGYGQSKTAATAAPLLGYDFIAGVLDNESTILDQPEEYYENLKEFRRKNKDVCMTNLPPRQALKLTVAGAADDIKDPGHTCVHGYVINDRLFVQPVNTDEVGRSVCPVCLALREEPTVEEPAFVRVSIPRSTLESPYRVKPHRRNSFDPSDSCALSEHCLAGYQSAKPAPLPPAGSVNLKAATDGLTNRMATTMDELKDMMRQYSKRGQLVDSAVVRRNTTRDTDSFNFTSDMSQANNSSRMFGSSQTTDNLLNTSYGLHYDLELMKQSRSLAA